MKSLKPNIRARRNRAGTTSWCVDAGFCNGKRLRRFFKSKAEATCYADKLTVARKNQGDAAFSLTDEQRVDAIGALALLAGTGATLREAAQYYAARVYPKRGSRLLTEIANELVEQKRKKNFKTRYVKALRVAFSVFNRVFGSRAANTVESADIEKWIDDQPYTAVTKRNYIRDIGILFRYAVKAGDCLKDPTESIEAPMVSDPEPSLLNANVTARLLAVAHNDSQSGLLPGLAIGFFAGLRSCEIESLTWSEIKLGTGFIEVKANKAKTRKRRLVDISGNLAEWLKPHAKESGPVLPVNWRRRLKILLAKADVLKWPKNCMRHNFASFHLAKHTNASLTALQLGHADTNVLFAHYRELVSSDAGKLYWEIKPPPLPADVNRLPLAA